MNSIKKLISQTQDSYERIKLLKDKFKGETIYLVTCGPSLTTHNREKLLSITEDWISETYFNSRIIKTRSHIFNIFFKSALSFIEN